MSGNNTDLGDNNKRKREREGSTERVEMNKGIPTQARTTRDYPYVKQA